MQERAETTGAEYGDGRKEFREETEERDFLKTKKQKKNE